MRRTIAAALSALGFASLVLLPAAPAMATDNPATVVRQTADAVIAVLSDKSLAADQRRQKIEDIVSSQFDFTTLARLVLARNWKQLNPEQQTQFVAEFRKNLSVTYGRNIESYNNEKAEVIGDREEKGGDWTVKTKIIRPSADPVSVDYRLRQQEGRWQVIDVIIEGVSLVANYRSQFQDIVSREGAPKLIELLHEKNTKGEPMKS